MRHRPGWQTSALTTAGCLALLFVVVTTGQSPQKPSPSLQVPRTPDGKPDLQGIWQGLSSASWDLQDHVAAPGVPAGLGVVAGNDIPYLPWAAEKKRENFKNRATADPVVSCNLPGVPRVTYMPFPLQIFQTAEQVTVAYEYLHALRTIYTNGTTHPKGVEFWLGDSRGRWEGDTLVVDVTNFTAETWFDHAGNFHSENLHLIERYTLVGPDHIQYEVTVEDPKVFARPWKMNLLLYRRKEPNFQLLEYECVEFLTEAALAK